MGDFFGTLIGKTVRQLLRLRHSGGQALPGLLIENLFPGYLASMLKKLPEGVIIITGTNGKTTTTKIVTELLQSSGKKVLTNSTGSNLTRGIASSISQHASFSGKLHLDMAILEVDEASARRLAGMIKPRWVLALNVSRDQLDRFGEVDTIASYIGAAMSAATEGVVLNGRDPHLYKLAQNISKENKIKLKYFGAAESLSRFFPSDYELAAVDRADKKMRTPFSNDVELAAFHGKQAAFKVGTQKFSVKLKLTGQHNYLNAAAALVLCRQLLPDMKINGVISLLSKIELAFGRGETYKLKNGAIIELVLVKNPASFTQALASYGAGDEELMIAINDNLADGRDVSWLWDVNFAPLNGRKIDVTSGTRAADMALRLSYDDITTDDIQPNISRALKQLAARPGKKVILSTYTAMLQLYGLLSRQGEKTP